jgi:hypothetical protein
VNRKYSAIYLKASPEKHKPYCQRESWRGPEAMRFFI